jgi:hypothetical protein
VKVFGGVLILRGIAAPHVAARHAQAQMDPAISQLQTFFTSVSAGLYFSNLVQMSAFRHWILLVLRLFKMPIDPAIVAP